MKEDEKVYYRARMPKILEALAKKQYDPYFFETAAEARRFILDKINTDETVGIGGSITMREDLRIVEALRKKGTKVYDHWEAGKDRTRRLEIKRQQRGVDVFLSGLNAITSDGVMVNLDGGGNRVASLCSGPRKVIAVTGTNKIVDSLDLAIHRTRNKTAVVHALRRNDKTPCVETGICTDCISAERICAALLILLKKPNDIADFKVILINEEMGY